MEFFLCNRCGTVHSTSAYRGHMDEKHDGRSDCVLNLNREDAVRLIRGEVTVSDICSVNRDPVTGKGIVPCDHNWKLRLYDPAICTKCDKVYGPEDKAENIARIKSGDPTPISDVWMQIGNQA